MKEFELFISHAVEDKESIANELNERLKAEGIKVWYSGDELNVGDSILQAVNQALKTVKFGVVILSPDYLHKRWTMRELEALVARENLNLECIFPIWHGVGYEDVLEYLPIMADRFAIPSERGMDHIVNSLLKVLRKEAHLVHQTRKEEGFAAMQVWKNTERSSTALKTRSLSQGLLHKIS